MRIITRDIWTIPWAYAYSVTSTTIVLLRGACGSVTGDTREHLVNVRDIIKMPDIVYHIYYNICIRHMEQSANGHCLRAIVRGVMCYNFRWRFCLNFQLNPSRQSLCAFTFFELHAVFWLTDIPIHSSYKWYTYTWTVNVYQLNLTLRLNRRYSHFVYI